MISNKVAIQVLNTALASGGDFAEIFLEETYSNNLEVDSGKTQPPSSGVSYGAGIRILKKLQSVYGYTNDLSLKGLVKLAQQLSASFNGKQEIVVDKIEKVKIKNKHNL